MVEFEAPNEFEEPLERWRRDGIERIEGRARAYTDRKINELQAMLEARMDAGIATEVTTTREFVLEVVGQALGQYREMIVEETAQLNRETFATLSTAVDALRDQVAKLGGSKEHPIDVPAIPLRRTH